MKLLVILFFTALLSYSTYSFFRKSKKLALVLSISIVVFILGFTAIAMARAHADPSDGWCGRSHSTTSYPPEKLVTAMDFFEQANYEYDKGDCNKAIENYSKSIKLNPKYSQSYNNRGYTYMRLREFDKALPDFNRALELKPNYYNALKNRADTYIYLKDYKKAEIDFEKAIEIGGSNNLCGDLFTVKFEGTGFWNQLFKFPKFMIECSKKDN